MTEDAIRTALSSVSYPGFSRDIISFGLVRSVSIQDGTATVEIQIQTRDPKIPEKIFKDCHTALDHLAGGAEKVQISIDVQDPPGGPNTPGGVAGKQSIPGVKKIIAVASGKGGVGKSTVSSNLAITLAKQGLKVGLCDCDLYGPSIALMFGASDQQPMADSKERIIPIEAHGIKLMSMGFILGDNSPVIVRGPLATRYTQQFLQEVAWGELDVLILDLPPGTGDIQLTIVQTLALNGAVIVTTPQEVALIDARKAISMFAKVNVRVLGIIENMSWFECDQGKRYHLFGEGGGRLEAERLSVPLLAEIPIDPETRRRCDEGQPVALVGPSESRVAAAFHEAAQTLIAQTDQPEALTHGP
jgi:ATP-binding protein involved in chromosome partitioning